MTPAASSAMRISAIGDGQCMAGERSPTCLAAPIIADSRAAQFDGTGNVSLCKQLLIKRPRLCKVGVHFQGRDEILVQTDLAGNDFVEIG